MSPVQQGAARARAGHEGLQGCSVQKRTSCAQLTGNWAAHMRNGTTVRSKDMAEAAHKWEEISLSVHPMQPAPGCWQLCCPGNLHRPDPQACPVHQCSQPLRAMSL